MGTITIWDRRAIVVHMQYSKAIAAEVSLLSVCPIATNVSSENRPFFSEGLAKPCALSSMPR
jgi:hypothetical protein